MEIWTQSEKYPKPIYLCSRKGDIKNPIALIDLQPLLFWNRATEAGVTDAYF